MGIRQVRSIKTVKKQEEADVNSHNLGFDFSKIIDLIDARQPISREQFCSVSDLITTRVISAQPDGPALPHYWIKVPVATRSRVSEKETIWK